MLADVVYYLGGRPVEIIESAIEINIKNIIKKIKLISRKKSKLIQTTFMNASKNRNPYPVNKPINSIFLEYLEWNKLDEYDHNIKASII